MLIAATQTSYNIIAGNVILCCFAVINFLRYYRAIDIAFLKYIVVRAVMKYVLNFPKE